MRWWWMSRWKIELRQRRGPKGSRWRTRVKRNSTAQNGKHNTPGTKALRHFFYFFFSPRLLCYCRCCCSVPFDYMWSRVWHIQTKSGTHPIRISILILISKWEKNVFFLFICYHRWWCFDVIIKCWARYIIRHKSIISAALPSPK